MSLELYDHQLDALNRMKNGCILCGGVGSGKSRTALTYYFVNECSGEMEINGSGCYEYMKSPKNLYIITTARKRDTSEWEKELKPFDILERNDLVIVVDSWNNIKKYIQVKDSFFIFDEQRVIGYGAWSAAFIKITRNNKWILLSATPGDTWSDYIAVFIANGFYANKTDFVRQHVVYSRYAKYPKVDHYVYQAKLMKLRKEILINMEYEKPTISHNVSIITNYDRTLYNIVRVKRWNIYKDEPIQEISQVCYLERRVVNSDQSRREAILDLVSKHDKSIIFYNFDYELEILREMFTDKNIVFSEWNGHKHQAIPKTNKWVYLVQYTAGAEGWNCIETNVIIFYSQNYSYKIMVQSAGRIDRLNTPFTDLYYYHLRSNAPIDKAITFALKKKKNFNESKYLKR